MTRAIMLLVTLAFLVGLPLAVAAQDILSRIGQPGVHAIMRHALAPGGGDPANFALRDCATQRNLDGRGRAQAVAAGQALRQAGARIDRLLSSQWCRCLETARLLGVGAVEQAPPLNSFFEARHRRDAQTVETVAMLQALPDGQSAFLVSHFVNARALTGRSASSGEIVVFRLAPDGAVDVLGVAEIPIP